MWKGNKAILEAEQLGRAIHLFVRFKKTEYTYYGEVKLVGDPFFQDEIDVEGNMRKVIKFPMRQKTDFSHLTTGEMLSIVTAGITPIDKPSYDVVGAAIINENGEVLCAQRGYGTLIGKWEFPGGKIENGETPEEALKREIKEELGIEINVKEFIDEAFNEYSDKFVNLKVYKCEYISGVINDTEHQSLIWLKSDELEKLDWADADKPILETYLDSLPRKIEEDLLKFNYFQAEAVEPNNKELLRSVQDYERSQKNKQKSGDRTEEAVLCFERDKLNNLGRPDLAEKVRRISQVYSSLGYDVLSFESSSDGSFYEIHIEVKSAKRVSKYIEFFISENELRRFKNDTSHKIYCLIKSGRNYKLHIVNKYEFFQNDYLSPMSYRVRIKVAE